MNKSTFPPIQREYSYIEVLKIESYQMKHNGIKNCELWFDFENAGFELETEKLKLETLSKELDQLKSEYNILLAEKEFLTPNKTG